MDLRREICDFQLFSHTNGTQMTQILQIDADKTLVNHKYRYHLCAVDE